MKKQVVLFSLACLSITSFAQKESFEWVEQTKSGLGEGPKVKSNTMIVKDDGSTYLAGTNGLAGSGVAYGQPCLAKYGPDGQLDWVDFYPGSVPASASDGILLEDSNGDLIAIYEGSEMDFDGTPTPVAWNYVIVKFDTTGEVQWVNHFGGNQHNIKQALLTEEGNVAIIVQGQFVTVNDTTITSNNIDILLALDGDDGSYIITDHAGYWPQGLAATFTQAWSKGTNSILALVTENHPFFQTYAMLTEVDLSTNTVLSQDTLSGIFPPATVNITNGTIGHIHDYDVDTKIPYVSGRASMAGLGIGNDSVFGVNPNNQSTFIAKMDFGSGDVLEKLVYYTPGVEEGVQLGVKGEDQITFFVQYRDTLRNTRTGDVYTEMDAPTTSGHPHCLIQNFDLDLTFNYYNQTAITGGTSRCQAAGYDANGSLYQLYVGSSEFHYDNTPFSANEHDLIAKMGGAPVGMYELVENNVLVHPNPARDQLFIKTEGEINQVTIVNMAGQSVKRVTVGGSEKTTLNVSDLSAGIYLVKVETSSQITITRVVIQ